MKRKVLFLLAALLLPAAASAAKLTVNVAKEGTLEEVINAQSVSNITELTITGRLSAPDIAYLGQCEGRIAMLMSLNMKDVTLVPSDEPYLVDKGYAFFISNEDKFVPYSTSSSTTPYSGREMFSRSRKGGPALAKAAESDFDPAKYSCYYGKNLAAAFQWSPLEKIILPAEVKKVGVWTFANSNLLETVEVPGGLTTIAENAFKGDVTLANINLSAVTEIGKEAFSGCKGLTEVNLKNLMTIGEAAFYGCIGLTGTLELPRLNKVSIGAFHNCTSLESATLSGASVIGSLAFLGCTNLQKVTFSNSLDTISSGSFSGTKIQSVTFPASLRYIGGGAFYEVPLETATFAKCKSTLTIAVDDYWGSDYPNQYPEYIYNHGAFQSTSLVNLALPEGMTKIGDGAFAYCNKLESISLPSSLETIGIIDKEYLNADYNMRGIGAFRGTSISKIVLPNGLKELGNRTFYDCTELEAIILPNSITEIGDGAFYYCSNLASVSFSNSLQHIGSYVFSETKWAKSQQPGSDGILYYGPIAHEMTQKNIPDGTTIKIKEGTISVDFGFINGATIGNNVTLELPSTLKNINEWAFRGSDITKIIFNEGLERISWYAFGDCTKLKSAELPSTLKFIGKRAFYSCTSLTKMTIPENVSGIGENYWSYDDAFEKSGIAQLTLRAKHLSKNSRIGSLPNLTRIIVGSEVEVLPASLVTGSADLLRVVFEDRPTNSRLFVGENCFPYSHISTFTLPDCQLEIGEYAFSNAPETNTVEVLGTVVKMEPYAFANTSALKGSVRLGGGITEIPDGAFYGCSGLTSVTIPNSVTSIGEYNQEIKGKTNVEIIPVIA